MKLMPSQPLLFDSVPAFDRRRFVKALRDRNVFVGTSSWRYEGWLGQIYTPERYKTRGRFSKKKFHDECIQEYAETFPVVGADFSSYSIPETSFWKKIFEPAPPQLKWDLKLPEDFTAKRFSKQVRYGRRAGLDSSSVLDAGMVQATFLAPLE